MLQDPGGVPPRLMNTSEIHCFMLIVFFLRSTGVIVLEFNAYVAF